jgi:NADPH:quinone reductase-like Zn-dependent oxidoreductase
MNTRRLLVQRGALHDIRIDENAQPPLTEGQARLRLQRFSLTANNVTYGVFGEAFGYWRFFPAEPPEGCVPVWGFADVVESRAAGLSAGARIYGYFPMGEDLVVTPARVSARGFVDAAAHRKDLPPVYNEYQVSADKPADEPFASVFRPLFTTGFLIDDFLAEEQFFGAERVVIASASSKTALTLAHLLKKRGAVEVVALTSPRNAEFCTRTGYFDDVVAYDAIDHMASDGKATLVDMAGDASVINAVAARLGANFVYNCMVGGTHWTAARTPPAGPAPVLFFAPDRIKKRMNDWGAGGFAAGSQSAWDGFRTSTGPWLKLVEANGFDAIMAAWRRVVEGKVSPEEAIVATL